MSFDLLEHTKQGYKVENGALPVEPQLSQEIVVQPKPIQNNSLEQVFQTYTNVSFKLGLIQINTYHFQF